MLNNANNENIGCKFYSLKKSPETRFAQYKYESLMSILKNVKVIVIVLENFIANESEKYNKNECLGILRSLTSINFLAKLLAIKIFFCNIKT